MSNHRTVQLRPTMTRRDLRVRVLLYGGSVPDDPPSTAYRDVHLWVKVTENGG